MNNSEFGEMVPLFPIFMSLLSQPTFFYFNVHLLLFVVYSFLHVLLIYLFFVLSVFFWWKEINKK